MKREADKPEDLIPPALPGGFRDALPQDMIAKQKMIDAIRTVFERFGFDPMDTPAIERTDVLTGGDENSKKIIFNVQGSEDEKSDTSLRFDLTVPLARVLAKNPALPKPFKRYQTGRAWRGERPQAGRYREFLQMDVDILGAKSLEADAEIIQVMYETLKTLGISNFTIRINNRNDLIGILQECGVPRDKMTATLIEIDKEDKRAKDAWAEGIRKASGLDEKNTASLAERLSNDGAAPPDVVRVMEKSVLLGVPPQSMTYDASLVRGLGYYTGSVFEAVLDDLPQFGSVFSGGRYNGLTARFSRDAWPAVGASIGVDRLFAALEELGKIERRETLTQVLILNLADTYAPEYASFANNLREAGINTAIYLGDDRAFQAQLAYGLKKQIPFLVIYGDKEAASKEVEVKETILNRQSSVPTMKLAKFIQERIG